MGQLEIFFLGHVTHVLGKLQFQVDAPATRQTPSTPETRFRTPPTLTGERGRLPGRGFRHRHPRPECFKGTTPPLRAFDSTTALWPPIAFPASPSASAAIDALYVVQVGFGAISDVDHLHGDLQFQVDAAVPLRRLPGLEFRISTPLTTISKRLVRGRRGFDQRRPPHGHHTPLGWKKFQRTARTPKIASTAPIGISTVAGGIMQ